MTGRNEFLDDLIESAPPQFEESETVLVFASELLEVVGRLCDVLRQENAGLASFDSGAVEAVQERKARFAKLYEHLLREAQDDPGRLRTCDAAMREELLQAHAELAELGRENHRLLSANIEAAEHLMSAIANAVNEHHPSASIYDRGGAVYGGAAKSRGSAVSVNQVF